MLPKKPNGDEQNTPINNETADILEIPPSLNGCVRVTPKAIFNTGR